ncbi:MIP/aquaporin family protein [Pararhizobium sp.]|uniref:MIP/aquaporin family protein n=1 Tax=Pararhizobium sp. TaxID=1977563 RepID=UPI0027229032|nr:MIP/aquaporin family protein [Pararhizobium sp.]MDO9414705.1 MIP/aquaporin family protein [Pararhizobium sp.]
MSPSRTRRCVAEGLGTGMLVATIVGSGIMAARLTADGALALLANTLPVAAVLIVLISILGPVSGAHFNPAVTVVLALRRAVPARDVAPYLIAQLTGGILGTWLAHLMFELPLLQVSTTVRTGQGQWIAEFTASFGLLLTILGAARLKAEAVPALVGLYITAAYWFTASTSFANPAVTIARSLTDTFSGIRPADAPAFVLAELAGALAAAMLAGWLFAGPLSQPSAVSEHERA